MIASRLRFCLNDRWIEESRVPPTTTVLRYLRDTLHLTATKEGCAEGDCGACTVAVEERDTTGRPTYRAVNACLLLLPMVQGKRIFTAEGLRTGGRYHPVQEALAESLGSQCGYCTPGITMSLFEACYRQDLDAPWKLDSQLCGNLCRCTGYRPIREAASAVSGLRPNDRFLRNLISPADRAMPLRYTFDTQRFYTPASLVELWELMEREPQARLVAGGTDLCLEITKRFAEPAVLISLEAIAELAKMDRSTNRLRVGAGVNLTDLETAVAEPFPPLARILRYFGSRQVKSRATLGGNLCNASPIGDLAPVLLSLGARVGLLSRSGERSLGLDTFFLAYRKTALSKDEILGWVEIPALPASSRASAFKVSKRRELDISTVAAGMFVDLDAEGRVRLARLGFGGMAATPARAAHAEAALLGQVWNAESVRQASEALSQDFKPISDHRGSARFRNLLARNLLRGFFAETQGASFPSLADRPTATVQVA